MSHLKKIMVPVDGSEGALAAARFAAQQAKTNGAELVLFTVYDPSAIGRMGLIVLKTDLDATVKRVTTEALSSARNAVGDAGIEVQAVTALGNPVSEIVGYATQNDVDLIVMGARGQSPLRGALMGSISYQTIYHAPCPVTVVRSSPMPPGDTASPGL